MTILNVDEWLRDSGIEKERAEQLVQRISIDYPALTAAVKQYPDVRGELELVALVHGLENKTVTL